MYERFAAAQGWKTETMDASPSEAGGFKEIQFKVKGDHVYSVMKFESGVHRVQRVPKTESQGRIQTSTATVAVLPEADDIDIQINQADLRVDTYCASGPGGQLSAPRADRPAGGTCGAPGGAGGAPPALCRPDSGAGILNNASEARGRASEAKNSHSSEQNSMNKIQ